MDDGLILVRVAVAQAGARQGQVRWVNADDPDIAERLNLGYLQRLPEPGRPEPDEVEIVVVEDGVDDAEAD